MQINGIILYFVSIQMMSQYFDRRYIDQDFFVKVGVVAATAMLPYLLVKGCFCVFDPEKNWEKARSDQISEISKGLH